MLKKLTVSNYAIIDLLVVEFSKGFNVITGETGAGKSIMVEALGLALGERADLDSLANKNQKCTIELEVELKNYDLEAFFIKNDLDFFEETIVRREISPEGKSRAFINDTPVTLQILKEFSRSVVDIHSQHQNLLLENPNFRLSTIDKFGGFESELNDIRLAFKKLTVAREALKQLKNKDAEIRKNFDFNQFQLKELTEAQLKSGMLELLEAEQKVLANATEIKSLTTNVLFGFEGNESGLLDNLIALRAPLQHLQRLDPNAQTFFDRLNSSLIELKDLKDELENYSENITDDPKKLEQVEFSLEKIYGLFRKHSLSSVEALLALQEQLEKEVFRAQNFESEIQNAEEQVSLEQKTYLATAELLSKKRNVAAKAFSAEIVNYLHQLGMPEGRFEIAIEHSQNETAEGFDQLIWLFSPNKGMPLLDTSKTASGGEISRLMLSIKALMATKTALPSLILDEIDTGVSGEIAAKTALIMKKASANIQVITITHLPQVAAKANHHLFIYKSEIKGKTQTQIKILSPNERIDALASMLSDGEISLAAKENARVLLGV
jgi:DNA repair protein RecN (Recombination protein N)